MIIIIMEKLQHHNPTMRNTSDEPKLRDML